jgi:hypothetical protein
VVDAHRSADAPPPLRIRYERHAGAASAPLAADCYRRREPEKTVLYTIVRDHIETFLAEPRGRDDGDGYPAFLEREFRRYLHCGLLARGFARLRCPDCGFERLVAFSCKGRLCPSCMGRRMADQAASLVDDLLPEAPYRQWVLTFPWPLRFRLSVDRTLFGKLLGVYLRTLFAWQRRRGRALGIRHGLTGSVSFVQRFGGALNLNPHIHSLLPDGLFVLAEDDATTLTFVPLPAPTPADIEALTFKIARRLTTAVERLAVDDAPTQALLDNTAAALRDALARALVPPIPKLSPELDSLAMSEALCAKIAGFSLHAARVVPAHDRNALESLCRYGLRAPFSQQRLSRREDGRVAYHLRRPWPNAAGATDLVLEPCEFLRRLAALVPAPYAHLIRYHGVFAGRSRWRARLPTPPNKNADLGMPLRAAIESELGKEPDQHALAASSTPPAGPRTESRRRRHLPWAQLLRRVFFLDALTCPRCDAAMLVLALLSEPEVVRKILLHLDLPADVPAPAPARCTGEPLFDDDSAGARPARPPP